MRHTSHVLLVLLGLLCGSQYSLFPPSWAFFGWGEGNHTQHPQFKQFLPIDFTVNQIAKENVLVVFFELRFFCGNVLETYKNWSQFLLKICFKHFKILQFFWSHFTILFYCICEGPLLSYCLLRHLPLAHVLLYQYFHAEGWEESGAGGCLFSSRKRLCGCVVCSRGLLEVTEMNCPEGRAPLTYELI